jgi:hypothetical protein
MRTDRRLAGLDQAAQISISLPSSGILERFAAKWMPVRVNKTPQNKSLAAIDNHSCLFSTFRVKGGATAA